MAQLYEQEFKTQEKAKYEHIRQAKEKAIEEQRIEAEKQPEQADVEATQGISRGDEAPNEAINGSIGTDWSQVSPEIAANYMSNKTGVSASKWLDIIYKESSGNPYALNSLSCYGLLQIMQSVHGQTHHLILFDKLLQ